MMDGSVHLLPLLYTGFIESDNREKQMNILLQTITNSEVQVQIRQMGTEIFAVSILSGHDQPFGVSKRFPTLALAYSFAAKCGLL